MSNWTPPDDADRPRKRGGSHTRQRHRPPPNPADLVMLAPVIMASCAAYLGVGLEVIIQETRDVASGTQSPTS